MNTLQRLQDELYLLQKSRDFITPRRHWAKRKYTAALPFGILRTYTSRGARSACAIGATRVCDTWNDIPLQSRVEKRLQSAAYQIYGASVETINDGLGHRAVLRVYDLAIESVKQEIERTRAGLNEPSIPIQVPEPAQEPRFVPIPDPAPAEPDYEPAEPIVTPEREPEKVPA